MFESFLITFRETVEAILIVSLLAGVFIKKGQRSLLNTVLLGAGFAFIASLVLGMFGGALTIQFAKFYHGQTQKILEGLLFISTAIAITWITLSLHAQFRRQKVELLTKAQEVATNKSVMGVFMLAFISVFREGVEIVMMLSSVLVTAHSKDVLTGAVFGVIMASLLMICVLSALVKVSLYKLFRVTTWLLVVFSAGLIARGFHEFAEAGLLPEIFSVRFIIIPHIASLSAFIKGFLGLTPYMDIIPLLLYSGYLLFMYIRLRVKPTE